VISDINIRIDRNKCTACGTCVDRCIMDNLRLSVAPCRQACPLHMNCQSYIRLLAQDREEEAIEHVMPYLPFLGILGRVCSHPCEAVCERRPIDGAVHIRAIKRYLADVCQRKGLEPGPAAADTGRSAAVIGSGPAGLMAAYRLRLNGHRVVVYEAASQPGGLMRSVIPPYRLPNVVLDQAIAMLTDMGIEMRTATPVKTDDELEKLKSTFDAVVLALGAGCPMQPPIEGTANPGVIQALDLLCDVKAGEPLDLGRSVLIVGGGDTAIDAALTCRRMGIETVSMVCLERPAEMPGLQRSLTEAREEGISIENCWGVGGISELGEGGLEVALSRCLSVFDDQGGFAPQLEPVCRESLFADTVVLATGQQLDAAKCPRNVMRGKNGYLVADPLTRQVPGAAKLFVCGDAASGPTSIVHAMADGWEAALSADRLLQNDSLTWDRDFWNSGNVPEYEAQPERAVGGKRGSLPNLPPEKRNLNSEQEQALSSGQVRKEAERCLSCGRSFEMNQTCWFCLPCEIECPTQALEVRMPYLVR